MLLIILCVACFVISIVSSSRRENTKYVSSLLDTKKITQVRTQYTFVMWQLLDKGFPTRYKEFHKEITDTDPQFEQCVSLKPRTVITAKIILP